MKKSLRDSLLAGALMFLGISGSLHAQPAESMTDVYRVFGGNVNGCDVWIVDGKKIREAGIPEFLYGGNHGRYAGIPENEIWIDHAISCEEYQYTVMHELCERDLMLGHGWTYDAAHDSALMVEQRMRLKDQRFTEGHERHLQKVRPDDYYHIKELQRLPDSLRLHNIYRVHVAKRDSIAIWIVDGAAIRRDVYPDFGFSGNDLAYHFIPAMEIWLDAQMGCEEMEFSIQCEVRERQLMSGGLPYDDAYEKALMEIHSQRMKSAKKAANHRGRSFPP